MALNNTTADALATSICTALGVADTASQDKYKQIYRLVYAALKADIDIIIAANSINTAGSASAQSGPTPSPITIHPA